MDLSAKEIVDQMYTSDPFSQWLGIERIKDGEGISILRMEVRKDMLNGFSIAHGGITYSLADSALAFSSNAYGKHALSVDTSIAHTKKVIEGDILTTRVQEISRSNRIGIYQVYIENQDEELVALFNGTVYITKKEWQKAT
jgi:acyl-CoA thioesterase